MFEKLEKSLKTFLNFLEDYEFLAKKLNLWLEQFFSLDF